MTLQNRYWRVVKPFQIHLRVGTAPANVWVGRLQACQDIYRTINTDIGDEIHELCGGNFLLHFCEEAIYTFDMRRFDASEVLLHPAPRMPDLPYDCMKQITDHTRVRYYRDQQNPSSASAVPLEVLE